MQVHGASRMQQRRARSAVEACRSAKGGTVPIRCGIRRRGVMVWCGVTDDPRRCGCKLQPLSKCETTRFQNALSLGLRSAQDTVGSAASHSRTHAAREQTVAAESARAHLFFPDFIFDFGASFALARFTLFPYPPTLSPAALLSDKRPRSVASLQRGC